MQKIVMHIGESGSVRSLIRQVISASDLLVSRADARGAFQWLRLGRKPHLIICEMNLPGSSGHQALQILAGNSRFADIPVILFASYLSPMDERLLRREGAAECLRYSSDPSECLLKIRELLAPAAGIEGFVRSIGKRAHNRRMAWSMKDLLLRSVSMFFLAPFLLLMALGSRLSGRVSQPKGNTATPAAKTAPRRRQQYSGAA